MKYFFLQCIVKLHNSLLWDDIEIKVQLNLKCEDCITLCQLMAFATPQSRKMIIKFQASEHKLTIFCGQEGIYPSA